MQHGCVGVGDTGVHTDGGVRVCAAAAVQDGVYYVPWAACPVMPAEG